MCNWVKTDINNFGSSFWVDDEYPLKGNQKSGIYRVEFTSWSTLDHHWKPESNGWLFCSNTDWSNPCEVNESYWITQLFLIFDKILLICSRCSQICQKWYIKKL